MKNHLLGILSLTVFSLCGQAQEMAPAQGGSNTDVPGTHSRFNRPAQRTNIISDWYNYGQTVYDMGGDVSYFRNFLFPDSTVKVDFNDGIGYVWKHSIGEVFDPSSSTFGSSGQYEVENHIPYTLDSISVPYRYWRYQNAVADTVVVQVYLEPNITLVATPGWSSGASYANVAYDYTKRIGQNETLIFKRPLTIADTSTLSKGYLDFQTNLNVPAGTKVAATVTYLPGNTYNVNDTIDTYASFTIHNRINAFVMYDYRDNDLNYEPFYYNNELAVPTDVRYNINTNGWNGDYIPGTAWNAGIYYGDIYFKITFDTDFTGVDEMENMANVSVYPNPTNGWLHLNSDVAVVRAEVKDMSGKTVITENGTGLTQVNVSGISSGVYVLHIQNANGQILRQRFVKQ